MNATLFETALRLRRAGRFAEAAEIYAQILAREPANFEALHALGVARYQAGQLEEAERLIGEAIALRPDAADALYNRACLLARLERNDEALASFDAALRAKPDYLEALANRGNLLVRLNRPADALASFDRALALKQGVAELWSNRAHVLLVLGRFDEAAASADHALSLKPDHAKAKDIRAAATASRPSLPHLEDAVARGAFAEALESALRIFAALDGAFGALAWIETGEPLGLAEGERATRFARRFASLLARLIGEAPLSAEDYERLVIYHRWIDLVFSLTEPGNSDAVLPRDLRRRLLLRSLDSETRFDPDAIWREDREAAVPAFLHYLASRCVFRRPGFDMRERLLEWLPDRLDGVAIPPLALSRMADTYMHCSYAATPGKHAIKAPLMRAWRRAALAAGAVEIPPSVPARSSARPTLVVVAEHLRPGHSVHRTHGRALAALKERFQVVGAIHPDPRGSEIETLFDACLTLSGGPDVFATVATLTSEIVRHKPALVFYLGVGMVVQAITLASLRLAPVQCVSFGHTATTMSPAMDYFILPEDFIGARELFSEKLVGLPKEAMPLTPRPVRKPSRPAPDGIVHLAVPASIMKLNPVLFAALAEIRARARSPMAIHFYPLGACSLPHAALERAVAHIPDARVFPELSHQAYVEELARCDLFVSPFPYGNMNSIVDAFLLGLPGVCLDGAEAHAHADAAYFARIRLPPDLTARTVADYIEAALRLIDDAAWRERCRAVVEGADLDAAFFKGNAGIFSDAIAELIARG